MKILNFLNLLLKYARDFYELKNKYTKLKKKKKEELYVCWITSGHFLWNVLIYNGHSEPVTG